MSCSHCAVSTREELCIHPKWILLRKLKVSPTVCGGAQNRTSSSGDHQQQDPDRAWRNMLDSPVSEATCPFFLPIPWCMTPFLHSTVQYLPNKRCWTGEKEDIILVWDSWQTFALYYGLKCVKRTITPSPSNCTALAKTTRMVSKKGNFVHYPKEKNLDLKKPNC